MGVPSLLVTASIPGDAKFDSIVFVSNEFPPSIGEWRFVEEINSALLVDTEVGRNVVMLHTERSHVSAGRLVLAPTGPLSQDTDDVRNIAEAASKGVLRAKAAGSHAPCIIFSESLGSLSAAYQQFVPVSLLAIMQDLYEPLQAREHPGIGKKETDLETVTSLWLLSSPSQLNNSIAITKIVSACEQGRRLARDVGGSDPERMSALNCASFIQQALNGMPGIEVLVKTALTGEGGLDSEYPLLHAVARSSLDVTRHHPCVVHLEYTPPPQSLDKPPSPVATILFAGKGVTYDTGGADVKTGGFMQGMCQDKCGAAAIAGLFLTASLLQSNVRLVAELGFVRNSIGSNAYVADEIITSHAGSRVLIGNTDAEGRMVLADCLSHLREQICREKISNPHLITVATLTGHAARSYGKYTAAVDNGPARAAGLSRHLQEIAEIWGDPIEVSVLRKEDMQASTSKSTAMDVLQCPPNPSFSRSHQFPVAFLLKASGLVNHQISSTMPLCWTHLDIAGSACEVGGFPGRVTATPIVALTARYLIPRA